MSWSDEKAARLAQVNNARVYIQNARGLADNDDAADAQEIALVERAYVALRDLSRHLRQQKRGSEAGSPQSAPPLKPLSATSMEHALVRFAGRLDKIEALFERHAQAECSRAASLDRFERAMLTQLGPLQDAVKFLLSQFEGGSDFVVRIAKDLYEGIDRSLKPETQS